MQSKLVLENNVVSALDAGFAAAFGCAPARYFSSVSILAENSGLADALSTALFCMSYEDGAKLVDSLDGVEVIWILDDGEIRMSEGIKPLIQEQK